MAEKILAEPRPDAGLVNVLKRLQSFGVNSPALTRGMFDLADRAVSLPAGTLLQSEQDGEPAPQYLLAGCACRFRRLPDGRRQIFDLVLPGEGFGVFLRASPLHTTNVVAVTTVQTVDARSLFTQGELHNDLREAINATTDRVEHRALNQIVRLGHFTALQRFADTLLEVQERLDVIGHVKDGRFFLPLTQVEFADWTGLNPVHMNRVVQSLRRQELALINRGWVHLLDQAGLARMAGRASTL